MAHWSEGSHKLHVITRQISDLSDLERAHPDAPGVFLLLFPFSRTDDDAANSAEAFGKIAQFCAALPEDSTLCFLTTPPEAARLLPCLEETLQFQLWVAVKTTPDAYPNRPGSLPRRHAALLVLTRYTGSLRHTKTRIGYTYCPACGKTTKDYGGKKHTYHEYGTLMSDVWRDIEFNPHQDAEPIIDRLRDLFGLAPYCALEVLDLRSCLVHAPTISPTGTARQPQMARESGLPLDWETSGIPIGSQLLNMDCLEALRSLPDDSVDFCFADPPYNLQKQYDHWNDALESIEYFTWCDQWLSEMHRVLKPGRTLAVLNIPYWTVRHYQHLCSIMRYQAWIAWDALSLPVRMIMPAHYAVLCFSKGEPRPLPGLSDVGRDSSEQEWLRPLNEVFCLRARCMTQRRRVGKSDRSDISDLWADIHRLKHNSRRIDHPCQLPPLLMRRLFALFTQPGEMILDGFNGAGTSTLVAQQMGRKFIGIELSPQYHRLALQRHEQIARGEDPFGKVDAIPQAKNSRVQRLPKQRYKVSKKTLQLDVKRIARELGRLPTREEVRTRSPYPMELFERYFVSWGEVCAAARTTGMTELPPDQSIAREQLALPLDDS